MVLKITNLHILRHLPTCWLYLLERYTVDNQRCTHTASGNPIIEETYYESDLPIIKGEMTEEQAQAKLKAVKAAKNQNNILHEETNNSTTESFLSIIREQAEEIGRLKEQIRQMTIEKGKHVSDAHISGTANVG